jgi:hypothetical protein
MREQCPICGGSAEHQDKVPFFLGDQQPGYHFFRCEQCLDYRLTDEALDHIEGDGLLGRQGSDQRKRLSGHIQQHQSYFAPPAYGVLTAQEVHRICR